MKSLAVLLKWICILFSLRLMYLIYRQVKRIIDNYSSEIFEKELFFHIKISENISNHWFTVISISLCLLLVYLIYKLNIFRKVVIDLSKRLIFTERNGKQLISIGKGIIFFGIILSFIDSGLRIHIDLQCINEIKSNSYFFGYFLGYGISTIIFKRLYIFMIALFILMIAKLINEGTLLKQENDLTI